VIAALRIVLHEVERQTRTDTFEIHIVNKWRRSMRSCEEGGKRGRGGKERSN
jgi:hypothetical protein